MDSGRAEAARELLADTDGATAVRVTGLGKPLPILAALLVPLMGLGLYLHLGSSDKVELTREFARPPTSLADITGRLERTVKAQPDSAESWYFLARSYMAQERPADAARSFEHAVALAGRQPELLGQWAQSLYFAQDKSFTPQVQALTDEALKADPKEVTSLGLLGIAAFEGERYQAAVDYWTRLLAALPAQDPSRSALEGGIERAREKLAASGKPGVAPGETAAKPAAVTVRVELAPALKDKVLPGDSVFIFARAVGGPPAPLAVKRVTVGDLPAEVELGDADAMMPQLKLSNFAQVQLMARVSRAGQPTRGEWVGRSQPLASSTTARQALTIDSPDK
jgi:cytochrome c-type biogenesis protein CcmH